MVNTIKLDSTLCASNYGLFAWGSFNQLRYTKEKVILVADNGLAVCILNSNMTESCPIGETVDRIVSDAKLKFEKQ